MNARTLTPTNSTEDLKGLTPKQIDDIASLRGASDPFRSEEDFALSFLITLARQDRARRRERRERKRAALARDRVG